MAIDNMFCCCRTLPIYYGLYGIAFHSLLQGMYGSFFVITSYYKVRNNTINYCVVGSHISLIPMALFIFWAVLYDSWKGARFAGFSLIFVTTFNFTTAIIYFAEYHDFKANSLLDKDLFWKNNSDWVDSGEFAFTFWHLFAFFLIAVTPLWWYYSMVACKYAQNLRMEQIAAAHHIPLYTNSQQAFERWESELKLKKLGRNKTKRENSK